jgi:hypothetical protein
LRIAQYAHSIRHASVMHATAAIPGVPYRGAMGRSFGMAMGLGALVLAAQARAAPPPRPRLPPPTSLRTDADGVRLRRQADGSLRQVDTEAGFVGTVHGDGRVEIRDIPDGRVEFTTGRATVDWMLNFVRAVQSPTKDRPDLEPPPPDREDRTNAGVQLTPPSPYGPAPILVGVGGRFGGAADLALRKGQRKQARAKQEFLDSTAPIRAALTRAHVREQQRAAQLRLGQDLATLWRDETRPLAERRRALFELWDDCEESMPGRAAPLGDEPNLDRGAASEVDAERGRGGELMRRRIEAFVRRVAPAGSARAFDEAELSRLNARRHSRQRFDPYGGASDEPPMILTAPGVVAH